MENCCTNSVIIFKSVISIFVFALLMIAFILANENSRQYGLNLKLSGGRLPTFGSKPTAVNDLCPTKIPLSTKNRTDATPNFNTCSFMCLWKFKDYDLTYCDIPKNCCTKTLEVFNYLSGVPRDKGADWGNGSKKKKLGNETELINPEYTNLLIVREPITRFVSGFINKCVDEKWNCDGYKTNVTGFIINLYQKFSSMDNAGAHHFSPQHWYCKINKYLHLYNKILVCDSDSNAFAKSLIDLLSPVVPQKKMTVVKEIMTKRGNPTKSNKRTDLMRNLTGDWRLIDCLLKIYHRDFELFPYFNDKLRDYEGLIKSLKEQQT